MHRGSMPGERRGGRQRATPNRRTIFADRIVAAALEHPTASRRQLLAVLVKDKGLPADIRMAIARKFLPARASRSTGVGEGASKSRRDTRVESASRRAGERLATLDVLFGVAQDATASLAHRRKAAAEAALYFLPKSPARGWPGAVADECGFRISPQMATEFRDSKIQLAELSRRPGSNVAATARKIRKLRARIDMIRQRLESPCPTQYGDSQIEADADRRVYFLEKRQAGVALTVDEDAEEARLIARFECFVTGPERAAKRRLSGLKDKQRAFRNRIGPRLTHKERVEIRLLRTLYSPSQSSSVPDPDNEPYYHPFKHEKVAWDGNLYPYISRLRPAPPEEEYTDVPRYIIGNPNRPETSAWKSIKKLELILNNRARRRHVLEPALRSRRET